MKTLHLLWMALASVGVSCAQNIPQSEVPTVVLNAFQTAYPKAADIDWEKKGDVYDVDFEIGSTDHELWIDVAGKVVRHEEEMASMDLPAVVQSALKKDFAAYKVDDVDRVEKSGETYYRIELDGKPDKKVIYAPDGKIVENRQDLY